MSSGRGLISRGEQFFPGKFTRATNSYHFLRKFSREIVYQLAKVVDAASVTFLSNVLDPNATIRMLQLLRDFTKIHETLRYISSFSKYSCMCIYYTLKVAITFLSYTNVYCTVLRSFVYVKHFDVS